jgi:endoglucanase
MTDRSHTLACTLWLLSTLGCASTPPPPAPPPATGAPPAPAPTPAAPPANAGAAAAAADWNAAPTEGSPGVDAPKLSGHELLKNTTFEGGKYIPWMNSFSAPANGRSFVKDGQFCTEVTNKGANPWDAQIRHREMIIEKGHTYSIRYMAHATQPIRAKVKVGMSGPPYKEYWADNVDLTSRPQAFVGVFMMETDDDPTAELAFHFAGPNAADAALPFTMCIDDVHLDDPQFVKGKGEPAEVPLANVLVNQTGYLPKLPKIATVKSASKTPLKWELVKAGGGVVASGETKVIGKDEASGDEVQVADFSSFQTPGKGYTLKVGSDASHPFNIEADVYKKLKYDALAYFYHNRSGIEIALPYAGQKQWARPLGHASDKSVPCLQGSGCDYKLDVSGGWYDAGDHGKYVVNGGISTWTMLNQYERGKYLGSRESMDDFADGKMNIPEKKNRVPDILDEARWEMEFMLRMQVPDGQPKAGMVHHKIHDKEWTALGTRPDEDKIPRFLWPPSTAATLNLAATAAQCARVWQKIDKAFSARCLAAAEKAWKAAEANPALFAGTSAVGGGPYDDKNVSDEFYWAAAELFITTKKDPYKAFMQKSPHYKKVMEATAGDELPTPMTWGDVASLGTISLAVVPNALPAADVADCKAAIKKAADYYADIAGREGYRVPFKPGKSGYPWGSSSFVLNNALAMALAYDFSGEAKYLDGVAEAMNYLLGRNPLDKSYVTGYGARPLQHPHHRFWAHQANPKYPPPAPGAVSGGPNSGLQDPYVQAAGLAGCAPEKCYADNIEAWSANEIAINWNAPLAWVAAWLDEKASPRPSPREAGRGRH